MMQVYTEQAGGSLIILVAPHLAFEMAVQTLPSASLPAESRIARAGCPIFAMVSSSLRWGPNPAPPKPYRPSKSFSIRSRSIWLARV
jgi:hypothetical protein